MNKTKKIMNINLAKGHFNVINGHQVLKDNFNDMVYPCQRYRFLIKDHEAGIPDIAVAYQTCLDAEMSAEEIIDFLILKYFPLKFFRVGNYEQMAIVLGFIGMRGSGKTISAVMVAACDFLLRGLPVWSNVPITIRVVYKGAEKIFTSNSLDDLNMLDITDDYGGGCVLYDEVNMEAAEGSRYASSANLKFAYAMQQIRKRMMSLIWTCQGWGWIDNRLRWQTDFAMGCRDNAIERKSSGNTSIGKEIIWRVHDLSGTSGRFAYDYELKHKYLTDYHISTHKVYIKPWWNSYDTSRLQGQVDYIADYRASMHQKAQDEANMLPGPKGELPENTNTLPGVADELISTFAGERIYCKMAWEYLGVKDKAIQTRFGRIMNDKGYRKAGNSKNGFYWIPKEKEGDVIRL